MSFGAADDQLSSSKAISKPLFSVLEPRPKSQRAKPRAKKLKVEDLAERRKADFAAEVRGNTRAKMDPFIVDGLATKSLRGVPLGIKRKRHAKGAEVAGSGTSTSANMLVDYGSD